MKIFVGTLYSGENEFEECVTSIQNQNYQNYEHFVFKNLPNREAHHTLFKSFKENAHKYDLLVKVDADMVICSNDLFAQIVRKMTDLPNIDVFSIAVTDFFTGDLINGLNCYRNTVTWDFSKQTMFVDIPEVRPGKFAYDKTELAPAAIHCKNPSKFQAFHYGVHRGLKSIQKIHSTTHWEMLRRVYKNFLITKDVRIGLAILGAELVYAGVFSESDVDYTNPRVRKVLEKYENMDSREIRHEIKDLKMRHWGLLLGDLRRKVLRKKFRTDR
ncbi:MAG: hypothetical protein PHS86_04405 [Syntrophaceae bacterium]|nr:hypothetical protein [Syntrophaceae bacterium]